MQIPARPPRACKSPPCPVEECLGLDHPYHTHIWRLASIKGAQYNRCVSLNPPQPKRSENKNRKCTQGMPEQRGWTHWCTGKNGNYIWHSMYDCVVAWIVVTKSVPAISTDGERTGSFVWPRSNNWFARFCQGEWKNVSLPTEIYKRAKFSWQKIRITVRQRSYIQRNEADPFCPPVKDAMFPSEGEYPGH